MRTLLFLLLLTIGFGPQIASAQVDESSPVFINFDVSDGLAGNSMYYVICDREGRIWASTNRGISCYDGASIKNYTTKDGLIENKAIRMFEDGHGKIWCMGYQSQLCYFEEGRFHPYRYNQVLKDTVNPKATFLDFTITDEEELFIVFQNGSNRLVQIDPNGKVDFGKEDTPERSIRLLEVGETILVHVSELPFWTKNRETLKDRFWIGQGWNKPVSILCETETSLNPEKRTENALRLQDGRLIVNTRRGFFGQLTVDGPMEMIASDRDITHLFQDKSGLIWEGRFNKGLYIYHPDDLQHPLYHWLGANGIAGITQDLEGGVWVGTGGNGLYYCPNRKLIREKRKDVKVFRRLVDREGNQLISKTGEGTFYQPASKKPPQSIQKQIGSHVTHVMMPENKSFFCIGADNGVYILDPEIEKPIRAWDHYMGGKLNGSEVSDSSIFFKSRTEICRAEKDGQVSSFNVGQRFKYAAAKTDSIWYFSDFSGLFCYDHGKVSKVYPQEGELEVGASFFRGDTLVSATQGEGILILTPDTAYTIGTSEGIPSEFVNRVEKLPDGKIAVATDKGVVIISLPFNSSESQYINVRNGLARPNIFGIAYRRDSVFMFNKDERYLLALDDFCDENECAALPDLSGRIGDSLINPEGLEVPYWQNKASFTFLTISMKNRVKYRYQLLGYEDNWIETDRGEASFGKLLPGTYTFRVEAKFEHESWKGEVVTLPFVIRSPFWSTWWFFALLLLCMGLVIWLGVRAYTRRIRKQSAARQKMLALKNEALRSQMNPHFTFNALNSIQSYITVNDKKSAANFLADFAAMMRSFLEHSREDFVCLEDEKTLLQRYMELEQLRFPGQFSFQIEFDSDLEEDMDEIPAMLVQPLVENAIIHGVQASRNTTRILVRFDKISDTLLRCRVINDGVELKLDQQKENHQSIGLQILNERLDNLEAAGFGKGTLQLMPAKGIFGWKNGVCAQLVLPYRHGA